MNRTLIAAAFAALTAAAAGCTSTQTQTQAQAQPAASDRARAPVTVKWLVDAQGDGHAQVTARIERKATLDAPLTVTFVTPEGAIVSPVPESFTLPPGGPMVMTRAFDVQWKEAPKDDLLVRVDVQGSDFGLHGEDAFRFGRPAPTMAQPPRAEESLKVGGKDFGQPVQMTK